MNISKKMDLDFYKKKISFLSKLKTGLSFKSSGMNKEASFLFKEAKNDFDEIRDTDGRIFLETSKNWIEKGGIGEGDNKYSAWLHKILDTEQKFLLKKKEALEN